MNQPRPPSADRDEEHSGQPTAPPDTEPQAPATEPQAPATEPQAPSRIDPVVRDVARRMIEGRRDRRERGQPEAKTKPDSEEVSPRDKTNLLLASFGRVITAMVTPFSEADLSIDYDEAQKLANHLLDNGSDGLVIAGSTGEGATLTFNEKVSLFAAIKDAIGPRGGRVIANSGTNSTAESIELSIAAKKAGVDGLLVVTPYYNKPPQPALLAHFEAVASATDLPVMVYDVPSRTATKIAPETLIAASHHPEIVAVKEASGDFSAVATYLNRTADDFVLFSGNDDHTLPLQACGAVGVVSVLSHLVGHDIREQFERFDKRDIEGAREIQASYMDLFHAVFATSNPIGIKAAMQLRGFKVGPPRPPLQAATKEVVAAIEKALPV